MPTPLDDAQYINLKSFKRDGNGVDTPVWAAPLDGKLVVFTVASSFKVKRIGRNPKVQVAKCTVRGALLGPWLDGTCTIVTDPAHIARIMAAFQTKYGFLMSVTNFFASVLGRTKNRGYLEITLT